MNHLRQRANSAKLVDSRNDGGGHVRRRADERGNGTPQARERGAESAEPGQTRSADDEGEREGRGEHLRSRAIPGDALPGAVAQVARARRRDPHVHPSERKPTQEERRLTPWTATRRRRRGGVAVLQRRAVEMKARDRIGAPVALGMAMLMLAGAASAQIVSGKID